MPLALRAIDQAAGGLPALAAPGVRLDLAVGMVRTIVIRVDAGATFLEHRRDMAVHLVDDRLGEEPTRDARLIRHHHHGQTRAVERTHGVDRPGIEGDALDAIQVADLLDDRAISVEEHGATRGRHGTAFQSHNARRTAVNTASTPIPCMQW
jgi:hypothetical protein